LSSHASFAGLTDCSDSSLRVQSSPLSHRPTPPFSASLPPSLNFRQQFRDFNVKGPTDGLQGTKRTSENEWSQARTRRGRVDDPVLLGSLLFSPYSLQPSQADSLGTQHEHGPLNYPVRIWRDCQRRLRLLPRFSSFSSFRSMASPAASAAHQLAVMGTAHEGIYSLQAVCGHAKREKQCWRVVASSSSLSSLFSP
jgi:hypothetical protein